MGTHANAPLFIEGRRRLVERSTGLDNNSTREHQRLYPSPPVAAELSASAQSTPLDPLQAGVVEVHDNVWPDGAGEGSTLYQLLGNPSSEARARPTVLVKEARGVA